MRCYNKDTTRTFLNKLKNNHANYQLHSMSPQVVCPILQKLADKLAKVALPSFTAYHNGLPPLLVFVFQQGMRNDQQNDGQL